MRLGSSIGRGGTPQEIKDHVQGLESAGVDVVWAGELYGFDSVSLMGFVAAVTERVEIGSSILPIYSRTPTLTAMTAMGLDAVSGGRFILGLGSSGPQVIEGWHGVKYDRPVGRTREIIDICRKVWRREVVTHDGQNYTLPLPPEQGTGLGKPLKSINHPLRADIPVYVASLGPANVQMTAEVADGWIPIFFYPEKAQEVWGEALAKGKANRASDLKPLEISAGVPVAIGDGLEELRDRSRPQLALYIGGMGARGQNYYNDLAVRYGFEAEAKEIQDLYLDGKKKEAEAVVPAALLEGQSLIGSKGYVAERIAAYKEAGITILNVNPVGPGDPTDTIAQVRELIDA
jgi:F420-dependent oxidoreductase-like protein